MSVSDSRAPRRLADSLDALRDRYFVGRDSELEVFRAALQREVADRPVALLYVHGPGGVGKTVLLRRFGRLASAGGASPITLDARDVEPSPSGFLSALRGALNLVDADSPFDALARQARPVLLIDTFELLSPLDTWLRELFLPQLPDQALVVVAGRLPPSAAWRGDPAWSELMQVLP